MTVEAKLRLLPTTTVTPRCRLPELGSIIEVAAYDVSVDVVFFGGADFVTPICAMIEPEGALV